MPPWLQDDGEVEPLKTFQSQPTEKIGSEAEVYASPIVNQESNGKSGKVLAKEGLKSVSLITSWTFAPNASL